MVLKGISCHVLGVIRPAGGRKAFVKTAVLEVGWLTSQHSEASVSEALSYFSDLRSRLKSGGNVLRAAPVRGTPGTGLDTGAAQVQSPWR